MIGGMETVKSLAFMLVLGAPVTALFVLWLTVAIRSSTSRLRPVTRTTFRVLMYVPAGVCASVSLATLGLWLWSWRYIESFDDPTLEPQPSWIDPTIDIGLAATSVSFALAVLVAGVTRMSTRVPLIQQSSSTF